MKTLIVRLDDEVRAEQAERIAQAIEMIKGVVRVGAESGEEPRRRTIGDRLVSLFVKQ